MSGRRTRPGDLARARKAVNKPRAQVPALRKERFLVAQEKRGLLKPGIEAATVYEDLARCGGLMVLSVKGKDPDEAHRERLVGVFNTIATILKVSDLPRSARQGLRLILMDLRDLLDGRHSETLKPVKVKRGAPPDPTRDWWARAEFALVAERMKRLQPKGKESDKAAYALILPALDAELRRFGLTAEDVLPGSVKATAGGDEENKEEEAKRAAMLERVTNRCVDHKYQLDGGSGTIPKAPLFYFQQELAKLDQIERAGGLRPTVSDDEIFDIALDFRMSFDRADHSRMQRAAQETLD